MTWSLAALRSEAGPMLVLEQAGKFYRLADVLPDLKADASKGLLDVLAQWQSVEPRLAKAALELASATALPTPAVSDFMEPIRYPGKIICVGANYYDHMRIDFNVVDFDKTKHDILYFLKPSQALRGPGKSVRFPSQSVKFDWELELVAVFGKRGRRISPDAALEYVAGYSVGLDLSLRDLQFNPRHRRKFDLFAAKAFDDGSPMGPGIVPARFVDPTNLGLKLWLNGEIKQNSHTREMIWSLAEQISELSQHVTIEPGDVLYTGSPAGVGFSSNTFLKVGDVLEAEITGLPRLRVEIVPDPEAEAARTLGVPS